MAAKTTDFASTIAAAYTTTGAAIDLGRGVHDGAVAQKAVVQIPLAMMNRHGLVAGATGTGKTRTLQGLAEQLSAAGVATFVADMKGDLSGLSTPGAADGPAPKRDAEGRRLGAKEKTRAKKRLVGERALAEIDAWLAGAPALAAAE